ncbi:MAG: GNAT family N-acetyltransferase [Saprospiraceae bacterium]|nr:GNAT family N-acetyltransferase [Saprospiraceae bacterium]MBP7699609.1 GNAT family N-acetyltransferase [Saprospiraceae bacterium]
MINNQQANKERYINFCKSQPDLPLFFQPFWLDAVCRQNDWQVALSFEDKKIIGCLVYFRTKKYMQAVINMPLLTPYSGVLLFLPEGLKLVTQYSLEKKIINELIAQLPLNDVVYYTQNFHPDFQNGLPFYWIGFRQTTLYTYRITHAQNWSHMQLRANVRNKIAKAKKELFIKESDDVALLYSLVAQSYTRRNMAMPFDFTFLQQLETILKKQDASKILIAYDTKNQPLSAIYLVFDKNTVYNLLLGLNLNIKNSSAVSYLLYESIVWSLQQQKNFDFEGTMLQSVEELFSGFGAQRTPYSRCYRTKNAFWELVYSIKNRYDKNNR